jgi:hypothetical protein
MMWERECLFVEIGRDIKKEKVKSRKLKVYFVEK